MKRRPGGEIHLVEDGGSRLPLRLERGDIDTTVAQVGFKPTSKKMKPDFGRLNPDVYYLQGFSGHGIALSGMAGKLVSEAIAGDAGRFDVFTRIPHGGFPGGPALRRPALVLAMLYYRIKDLL